MEQIQDIWRFKLEQWNLSKSIHHKLENNTQPHCHCMVDNLFSFITPLLVKNNKAVIGDANYDLFPSVYKSQLSSM